MSTLIQEDIKMIRGELAAARDRGDELARQVIDLYEAQRVGLATVAQCAAALNEWNWKRRGCHY